MGAWSNTYNTFPSESGSGTGTPQSKSRVMALGCKPPSIHDIHCPITWFRHAFGSCCCLPSRIPSLIQGRRHSSCRSIGKNQCDVVLRTGDFPLRVETGFFKSVGLKSEPHFSHLSP